MHWLICAIAIMLAFAVKAAAVLKCNAASCYPVKGLLLRKQVVAVYMLARSSVPAHAQGWEEEQASQRKKKQQQHEQ